jgi:hypothetical protein
MPGDLILSWHVVTAVLPYVTASQNFCSKWAWSLRSIVKARCFLVYPIPFTLSNSLAQRKGVF